MRVLGGLSVDGLDVGTRLDRKARMLLRLLATARGRTVSAESLIDALWPEGGPSRPGDQLSVLASRIRRVLGRDTVTHVDRGYRLSGVSIDLDELDAVVMETERRSAGGALTGAAGTARIALAYLRGPLVDPTSESGAEPADWVLADHAAAVRLVRRARHAAATALLGVGDWPEALALAGADRDADPYDEAAVRLVMRCEVLAGRPGVALTAYAGLRALLAEELGTDPAPETDALHTAILRGEIAAATRVADRARLVGRESQLRHLDSLRDRVWGSAAGGPSERAWDGRMRVAVVTGEAGVGKTTLVGTWAELRAEAGDTVLRGTCGPLDAASPLDVVLVALGEHLRRTGDRDRLLGEDAVVLGPLIDPGSQLPGAPPTAADPVLGPATLYAALTRVLARIAGDRGAILVVDDAHLAGRGLGDWLRFAARRSLRVLVVAARRPGEGVPLPATDEVAVGPLDLAATEQLVGRDRAPDLHRRSGGHPLFLVELAGAPSDELPASLVAAVLRRCDELDGAADLIRAAAVLGGEVDVDLLAAVLGLPVLEALAAVELAEARGLLTERAGRYAFRHELVREALASGTATRRAVVLHAQAARVLAARPDPDPLLVAEHAERGGDPRLAAAALRRVADRASARFDHATARRLLDRSLALCPDDAVLLARARVRIRLEEYREAETDALAATGASAAGAEVATWAAYFGRRFDDAVGHARDGELSAADEAGLGSCLAAGGRVRHARGDLDAAEELLVRALDLAHGEDRLTAAAWLGVLQAHRNRQHEALELLRPATRPGIGADHTSAALHALLFTGHVHAIAGRPAAALDAFERYTTEVERRQAPRFAGRGVNFGGWVQRNLGAVSAGVEAHHRALESRPAEGTPELEIAALEDLAEERLHAGDVDGADGLLSRVDSLLVGDLVFGWRLGMKRDLLGAQRELLANRPEEALVLAGALRDRAERSRVPRYSSVAALLEHRARAALGDKVDPSVAWRDLDAVAAAVRIEAWWWAGETGAALGQQRWLARAEVLADELARGSAAHAATLRGEADRRLTDWRRRVR